MFGVDPDSRRRDETFDQQSPGGSPSGTAEPLVRKAEKIVVDLHHNELLIPHLLLAVAISGNASEYLRAYGLRAGVVRQCCWRALEAIEPEIDLSPDIVPSPEINELFGYAATFSNGRELEVSHILRAINDVKLVGKYGSLIRDPEPRPEEIDVKLSQIKERLDKELPQINRRLDGVEAQLGMLVNQVTVLLDNIGNGVREGDLHSAMTVLRTYTTTLKYIVIISAVALAFVVAMIRIIGGS